MRHEIRHAARLLAPAARLGQYGICGKRNAPPPVFFAASGLLLANAITALAEDSQLNADAIKKSMRVDFLLQ
jgi:hypothetical protein